MSERGRISIRTNKKGKTDYLIHLTSKKGSTLSARGFDVPEEYDGKICEVENEGKKVLKIFVDGKELPKKQHRSREPRNKFESGTRTKLDYSQSRPKQNAQNIYSIKNTKLPKGTRECLDNSPIDNFNLKLNKCVNFVYDKEKKEKAILYKSEYKDNNKWNKFEIVFDSNEKLKTAVNAISNRQLKLKNYLELQGYKTIEPFIYKPEWRMVVGLGNPTVYETSMTLHHIYGIPYIPGSAIKGVVRSYIITESFGKNDNDEQDLENAEEQALKKQWFCDIFGCPKNSFYKESRQGKVIFFDAFPLSVPNIKPDVMNPHYSPYYSDSSGSVPPADYHKLNPIFFLTVVDTKFQFIIGIKGKDNNCIQQGEFSDEYPLSIVQKWLKNALSEHGIGAKTAVGYGYMS